MQRALQTRSLRVCLYVNNYSGTTACGLRVMPTISELNKPEKYNGDFPKMAAFERLMYVIKRSEKANMHNHTGVPRLILLVSVYLRGTRSHNRGRVSTPACYVHFTFIV